MEQECGPVLGADKHRGERVRGTAGEGAGAAEEQSAAEHISVGGGCHVACFLSTHRDRGQHLQCHYHYHASLRVAGSVGWGIFHKSDVL